MRQFLSLQLILLFAFNSFAQNKNLSMEDAILKSRTTLAPKNLKQLMWINETDYYYYTDGEKENEALYVGVAGKRLPLKTLSITELNAALKNSKIDTLSRLPFMRWLDTLSFSFFTKEKKYCYFTKTKTATAIAAVNELSKDAENISESSAKIKAYTIGNNLYVSDSAGVVVSVSNDTSKNIIYGQAVHRNEFGINSGTFWSPTTGTLLAFYRMDQRLVSNYPIINWAETPAQNSLIKYPMAGGTSHFVTIGIFNTNTKKTCYLKTGAPDDQYLTNVCWSPDEKSIFVAIVNREQNHLWLNQYDAATGEFVKTLFEETDEKYVEPENPMLFLPKNNKQFIWQSKRDGYNHLYLYNVSGSLEKQLTKGSWTVMDFVCFDAEGKNAFFESNAVSPVNKDLYSVGLNSAKITKLTNGDGYHTAKLNSSCTYLLDNFSNIKTPKIQSLVAINKPSTLLLNEAPNPLADYSCGTISLFTISNKVGTSLFCRMYYPSNFDSSKKYPVIVYLYGGSHVQLITNSWQGGASDLWFQYMAQKGFIVFSLDNRGSSNRGKNFEQATFRKLGTCEMEDQLTGVNYLKKLKYVDTLRMGVSGWSFGGFLTTSLMTRNPGTFKVAVAGGPVIDWSMYEIMYTERYMDTPQSNAKGYKENNLLNYAEKLQGKLLLIHGTDDDVVVWQHSLKFINTCVDKNIPVDYFVYPGHKHNVIGKNRVHLMNKISEYFIDNL